MARAKERVQRRTRPAAGRIHNVIASTDLSDFGNRALPWALRLARDHGAVLTLVHVLDTYPLPNPLYARYVATPTQEQRRRAETAAKRALRRLVTKSAAAAVRVEAVVAHGDPAREILRVAAGHEAPLVVIASHGRTGIARLALGSVAERVIRAAEYPVFVVR